MDLFAQDVEGWHDFYIMVGTAAATLLGLLFVSLSLNADAIARDENADLRVLAAETFTSLLAVLMFAVLFLIPDQGPQGLGLPLFGIGVFGLYKTVEKYLATRNSGRRVWGRGTVARRFAVPTACFAALLVVALTVLRGLTGGLYWLVTVMLIVLMAASVNSWDLLLRMHEPPHTGGQHRRQTKD